MRSTVWLVKQNIYDDPAFLAGYEAMRARRTGAHETIVVPMLTRLLPELHDRRVLDLGCGDGWFSRWAAHQGASSVTGVDPSFQMLRRATEQTSEPNVRYVQGFAEDIDLPSGGFDSVVSVFALHYVEDLPAVIRRIASWLAPGGVLVAVLEHPIYLASAPEREFEQRPEHPLRWLLSGYAEEGRREEHWFVDGVVKYHRQTSTILNALIDAGLVVERVEEPMPGPPADEATLAEARARPVALGIRGRRPDNPPPRESSQ
jgi:ubiquinone/menaquinone biosynthesis C-methylase UbiE